MSALEAGCRLLVLTHRRELIHRTVTSPGQHTDLWNLSHLHPYRPPPHPPPPPNFFFPPNPLSSFFIPPSPTPPSSPTPAGQDTSGTYYAPAPLFTLLPLPLVLLQPHLVSTLTSDPPNLPPCPPPLPKPPADLPSHPCPTPSGEHTGPSPIIPPTPLFLLLLLPPYQQCPDPTQLSHTLPATA